MFDGEYTDIVIDHFRCPRNVGSMHNADGKGSCGDPNCGDFLTIYIKVKDDVIDDIIDALEGLPENKKHCSNLGVQALKNAIKDYYTNTYQFFN